MDEAHGEHEALQRLCAHFGIAPDYHDIFGHRHVIAPANLRALLGSFGVDATAPLVPSLAAADRALWARVLPPALAIDAEAAHWSLVLRLPAVMAEVGWSLEEESGVVHRGHIDLHAVYESARFDIDGVALCERRVELALPLPMGYHRLRLEGHADEALVIAAPPHCYQPPALEGDGRVWGPALQLYALRSNRNWGIGDFSDLARFAQQAAARGAGIIGLNPLHALFPHNPAHASPYSPSSRLQLDVLYIDVESVEEFRDCEAAQQRVQAPEFQARLATLRDAELVDYPGVAAAKFEVLALLYRHFCERGAPAARQAFSDFCAERGEPLRRHALFEALQAHFHEADESVWGWPVWPEAYRTPDTPEVAQFAQTHAERIGYFQYLQWQAAKQLAHVGAQCDALGMAVGLYLDLAVSVDRAGSDAWCEQPMFAEDLGTVADEMRGALARFQVLSYRLFYFEREHDGDFKPPTDYPRHALVAISTHDLATLTGWWGGHDLRLRLSLGLFPSPDIFEKQLFDRAQERVRLLLAVQRAGLLSADAVAEATGAQTLPPAVVAAIHAYLASTPSQVMMVQLEDAIGMLEQANMPGTTDSHPNWRRKLALDLQQLAADPQTQLLCETLAAIRPHPALHASARRSIETVIPRATYRLQFHKDFRFDDAIAILPYLARLGVSHIYCSPVQRARPGSTHGYDVVAHDEINPELGGREGFDRFSAALKSHGMGQLLDLVPNHMGVLAADNAWWLDVLENGPSSLYAQHFDIDWLPLNVELHGKVLLPVLGDHYGDVLARGELVLAFDADAGSLALHYHEHSFPLAPETYPRVLQRAEARVDDAELSASLASIASSFGHLPPRSATEAEPVAERARDKEVLKGRLSRLVARQLPVAQAIAAAVAELNLPAERDTLHALLELQAYRLAFWRVAADEINYRRFFDINELAALRIEREEVFEATQGMALDLAAAGIVDGLRIDHPDGLYDPARYFERLQRGFAQRAGLALPGPDEHGRPARPLYVVAEKIAASHEEVPVQWHIHGTTGYRFATVVNGVLVDAAADERFTRIWRSFSGVEEAFEELAYRGKRAIMRNALSSELNVLSTELLRIARADRHTRDYTLNTLRRALAEVAACMQVYRSYIIETPSAQDRHYIDQAVALARTRSLDADESVFDFVRRTLLGEAMTDAPDALRARALRFAIRFQQFSAPVTAKGVEDTAFYRYFPLSSLNEVGGEPAHFGMTVAAFHTASADRALRWPHTMLATSTHDNKRSEDVRNRINVLSEMPAAWRLALRRWRAMNVAPEGVAMPSAADQYLLYQTLLGTLPAGGLDEAARAGYVERIERYALKAARESKAHTSWVVPNPDYEAALTGFVQRLLASVEGNAFLDDVQALGATLAWYGALNSLSMTLIKYASPGVPDLYQGNELMDLSLVDPDNRRPVDYALRARWLDDLATIAQDAGMPGAVQAIAASPHDGRAKLWLTWRLLGLRSEHPALFRDGSYTALQVRGAKAAHVLAFMRQQGSQTLVVVAGRLFASLETDAAATAASAKLPLGSAVWGDTLVKLPGIADGAQFLNVLTGETLTVSGGVLRVGDAMAAFPGAALLAL
ncbi:MAG: malto-oligosyltrehalose synthase [Variovorax sp.]|nr:MAG: malto-oligosyltrehalose synthase [Variovorax sp.]